MGNSAVIQGQTATRPRFQPQFLGLAFFWACSMLTFRSSALLSDSANSAFVNTLVVVVSFLANMTTLLAISTFVERSSANLQKLSPWPFCICVIVGLALVDEAGGIPEYSAMLAAALAGAAIAGVGYGYFWGSWADVLGKQHPSRTAIYAPAVFFLTTAIFLAVSLLMNFTWIPGVVLMAPLPIISLACLLRCRSLSEEPLDPRPEPSRYLEALTSLVPLIIATLVFSCLFGFIWESAVLTVGSASRAHELPLALNLLAAAALLAFVLISHRRIDISMAYQVLIPISVLLFAVLPFFWDMQPVLINAIMSTVYGVFDVIIWYLVASTAYDYAVSGFVVGGIVRALAILCRLIGIGIGYIVALLPDTGSAVTVGVSIGAIYLLLALLWILRRSARKKKREAALTRQPQQPEAAAPCTIDREAGPFALGAESPQFSAPQSSAPQFPAPQGSAINCQPSMPQDRTAGATVPGTPTTASNNSEAASAGATSQPTPPAGEGPSRSISSVSANEGDANKKAVYALIAEDYGLTRREAEVLPYLAKGRSAKVIADTLFVSEPTIRTHTRRILEKTCLHSKQELIDLVEHY